MTKADDYGLPWKINQKWETPDEILLDRDGLGILTQRLDYLPLLQFAVECVNATIVEPIEDGEEAMKLDSYYFAFESTNQDEIDEILTAVAAAGRGSHHTDSWCELDLVGPIQSAAATAARIIRDLRDQVDMAGAVISGCAGSPGLQQENIELRAKLRAYHEMAIAALAEDAKAPESTTAEDEATRITMRGVLKEIAGYNQMPPDAILREIAGSGGEEKHEA